MKIGFNLLLWTTHVESAHHRHLETLKAAGYDGVEIPCFGGEVAHYRHLGGVLKDLGLEATALTIIPDVDKSPASEEAWKRQAALDHLAWAIDCTAALDATILAGPFHQPLGVFTGNAPTAAELGYVAEVHREAADIAAPAGVTMVMEYLNRFECYMFTTMADAMAHAGRVDHPNFGVMYDSFHANIEEKDPLGCIGAARPHLKHVHISENDRGTPGRGHLCWPAIFNAIRETGYDDWLTIEAFGRALPDLAAATRVWRDFFPDAAQVYTEGHRLIRDGWAAAA